MLYVVVYDIYRICMYQLNNKSHRTQLANEEKSVITLYITS